MSLATMFKAKKGEENSFGGSVSGKVETERKRLEHGAAARDKDLRLKIGSKDTLHILIQMHAMLSAGVPLLALLRSLIEHAQSPKTAKVLRKITEIVESGHDLSYAMDCLPRCFEKYVVHLIAAGEKAGALDDSMERSIEMMDKQIKLAGKIKGALAYPSFLIVMTFVLTTGILYFLVPKFEKLLLAKPDQLPANTKVVLGTSALIREQPIVILLFYGGIAAVAVLCMKVRVFRKIAFDVMSHMPGLGNLITKAYISRSVNALAMTLESGVPILTGLEHARQISQLPRLQAVWDSAAAVVRDGRPMHTAMADAKLPPALIQMIIAGESSGSLDASLRKAGEFLDRETQAAMEMFVVLLGPMTVVMAGCTVGFIVVSLMTPILQMAKFVG